VKKYVMQMNRNKKEKVDNFPYLDL